MINSQINSYGNLQQELDNAKSTLVALNDNIRRIIGRSPRELRSEKRKPPNELKRNDSIRQSQKTAEISKFKRRVYNEKSVFNRLSAPSSRSGDDESRPRLNSRVIRELPTRQEIVAAQCLDSESRARNRRMFGSLLGTLHKFCLEESRLKQKEDKKAQIEKKLEQQAIQERETLRKERESLFMDRKRKQLEIRAIELKMNRLKDFESWKSSMTSLKQCIRTKTKPYIYYKPKSMCKKTERLLLDNKIAVDLLIKEKQDALNKELSEIENSLKMADDENEMCFENINNNDTFGGSITKSPLLSEIKSEFSCKKSITSESLNTISKIDNILEENDTCITLGSSVAVIGNIKTETNKMQ